MSGLSRLAGVTDDLAALLARSLAPGEAAAAAAVLEDAAAGGEARLARFLDALAFRLERHPEPVRAEELRALLKASR